MAETKQRSTKTTSTPVESTETVEPTEKKSINCLRNEKITVRFIKKQRGTVEDPRSPLYGGMAETSTRILAVPIQRSGAYVNVLTNDEKEFLEKYMGLPEDALSVYKKIDNYWCTSTANTVNTVRLTKRDTFLDLSNPEDYIRYKILLANKDLICPDLETLENAPRATYMFVLISDKTQAAAEGSKADLKLECYDKFLHYKSDASILRAIAEAFEGHRIAANTDIAFLKKMVSDAIEADSKRCHKIMTDPYLEYKALIKTAVDKHLIADRRGFYYLLENNQPLCESNDKRGSTLQAAAEYLGDVKNQEVLYSLQAQV